MADSWSADDGAFQGTHYRLDRTLNQPQPLQQPRPRILIGGGGEKKTLRLVARYADASNLFGDPDVLRHKYRILAEHCEAVGRPYDEIERTTLQSVSLFAPNAWRNTPETADQLVDRFGRLGDAGVQQVIINTADVHDPDAIALLATEVMPQLAEPGS